MKDMITAIGSIMILMIFVMQFCSNQVIATKILMADTIVDNIVADTDFELDGAKKEDYKKQFARCFNCEPKDITITDIDKNIHIQIPIKNVIACGEFLGIDKEDNKSTYSREIILK